MKTLETERLLLRAFEAEDFEAVHAYASAVENIRFMLPAPNTEASTRAFLAFAMGKANETPCLEHHYAVLLKAERRVIGSVKLALDGNGEAEIGWVLHRAHWGQGYAAEAARRVLGYAFGELNLHRVLAHCDAENAPSWRLMERLGMRREGCFLEGRRAALLSEKEYADEYSYAILQREWRNRA